MCNEKRKAKGGGEREKEGRNKVAKTQKTLKTQGNEKRPRPTFLRRKNNQKIKRRQQQQKNATVYKSIDLGPFNYIFLFRILSDNLSEI